MNPIQTKYTSFKQKFTGVLFLLTLLGQPIICQTITPDATAEAENGILTGGLAKASSTTGYSGTGYVTNFRSTTDKVTVTVAVATTGFYKLVIRYQSEDKTQDKTQNLYVNGNGPSAVVFPKTSTWSDVEAGKYLLTTGSNTIAIQSSWGYIYLDKFSLYSVPKNTYNITPNLVNPSANSDAKSLYAFLVSKFNVRMISGQTDDYYDKIKPIAGKTPMIRGFDFQHYTQGYSWLWDNNTNGFSFGWEDNGQTQKAINWYKQTGNIGIVSFQWHWHSPSGGTVGTNTFYKQYTTFDASKAVVSGTQENKDAIRDIDSIATQLKKLQAANVPVLFRPLHEASGSGAIDGSGAWFWWGVKGATVCKELYNIMYDRLTNYHGLNNLIWVWSSSEPDWYPGNDSIDIVGYDSYPGVYNYDPQKASFDKLYSLVNGEKIIAMTENGPIPNPDNCITSDAPWAYFMSWSDLVTAQNTNQHIIDVFNNGNVITLENPTAINEISTDKTAGYQIYPNPASETVYIKGHGFTRLELIDMSGKVVFATTEPIESIQTQSFNNGVYILKIFNNLQVYQVKLLIYK